MNAARIEWNIGALRAGAILNVRGTAFRSRLIRMALGGSWSNHDALLIPHAGRWWIGDAEPPRARLVTLDDYAADSGNGLRFRILWPAGATVEQGRAAADWWIRNVKGRPYDFAGMASTLVTIRLLAKAFTVLTRIPWPVEWHWAWYCTEGVRDAWRIAGGHDPWQKANPTPRTTEKRLAAGLLRDVSDEALRLSPP